MRSYFSPDIIVVGSSFDLILWPTLLTLTIREPGVAIRRSSSNEVEREVAEVVDTHLQLEPVGGGLPLGVHQPGVVDQQVEMVEARQELVGGGPHRLERREVERLDVDGGVRVLFEDLRCAPPHPCRDCGRP